MGKLTLFVVSKESELLLDRIVTHAGPKVVFCAPRMIEIFQALGVHAVPFAAHGKSVEERDRDFAEYAMPGVFGEDTKLTEEGSSIQAYKVLGIDRLRFWYHANWREVKSLFEMVDFDHLVVSFDITSVFPWLAADVARERGVFVEAVKVSVLTTRETIDFLQTKPIDKLIVSTENERQMLTKEARGITYVSSGIPNTQRPKDKKTTEKTLGIYFEFRYDWKFLGLISELEVGDRRVIICVPDNKEWLKFIKVFPDLTKDSSVEIQNTVGLFSCAEVYLPAYIEEIVRDIPDGVPITYYDLAATEKAGMFSERMT